MEKIVCRDARSRDCVEVARLFKKMWDELRPEMALEDKAIDMLIEELVKSVQLPNMYLKVGVLNGKIVSFLFGSVSFQRRLNRLAGYCYDIYVEPELRKTNLGVKMIEDIKDWGRKQGAGIALFVVHGKDLHKWFKRRGYEEFQTTFSIDLTQDDEPVAEVS